MFKKVVPFVATISAGLNVSPVVTNNISQESHNIDRVMPFGEFGDVSSSSMYIAAEQILK